MTAAIRAARRFAVSAEDQKFYANLYAEPEAALWMQAVIDLLDLEKVSNPALACLLLLAGDAALNGDLCLHLTEEKIRESGRRLASRIGEAQLPEIRSLTALGRDGAFAGRFAGLVSDGSGGITPFVLSENRLYAHKYFTLKQTLARHLRLWIAAPAEPIGGIVRSKVDFNPEQLRAIDEACRRRFMILTGGPGTGKTTVIQGILSAFFDAGLTEGIWIAAPTGRAARRAAESAAQVPGGHVESGTIHRLLRSLEDSVPGLILIDEVSMVDLELMTRLLERVDPSKTRLILIGDRNQLPSVDAGAVLGDLVELFQNAAGAVDSVIELTKSHRSGDRILAAAARVNEGVDFDAVPWEPASTPGGGPEGCFWIDTAEVDPSHVIRRWTETLFPVAMIAALQEAAGHSPDSETFAQCARDLGSTMRSRVLCVTRQGRRGAETINSQIMKQLNRRLAAAGALFVHGEDWFSGMPLLVARNDEKRDVYNGETGILLRNAGGFRAVFDRGTRLNMLTLESLPASLPAFAVTVHKSQGSEYDDVLVILPDDATHPLISRQILYTAITRARKRVFVAGHRDVLQAALKRKVDRETGGLMRG